MPDLREALEAALDKQNAEEPKEEVVQPEVQATKEVTDDSGTGGQPEDRQEDTQTEQAAEPAKTETDSPKFLPPEEEQAKEKETETGTAESESVEPGPIAWRAAAKQHWKDLPPEVRQEVARREKDIQQGLRDSTDARRFHEEFGQAVEPYRPLMQGAGVDPLTATKNLWQMAATLQMGNPQQKAQMVAQIIQQNAVDLQTLNDVLVGQVPAQGGNGGTDPGLASMIQRELAPVRQFMGSIENARQQKQQEIAQTAEQEIEKFAQDPANLFFEDVHEDMADMLELASQRGRQMSLKEAYDRAVAMRPDLVQVVQHQQGRQTAVETAGTLARKKRAASSVQGVPAQPSNAKPLDMTGQLNEAWDLHSGGGH